MCSCGQHAASKRTVWPGRCISHSAMCSLHHYPLASSHWTTSRWSTVPSASTISCFFFFYSFNLYQDTNTHCQIRADLSGALTSEPEVFTTSKLYIYWPMSSWPNDLTSVLLIQGSSVLPACSGPWCPLQYQCSPAGGDSAPVIRTRGSVHFLSNLQVQHNVIIMHYLSVLTSIFENESELSPHDQV